MDPSLVSTSPRVTTRWKNQCGFAAPHRYFRELIKGASDTGKSSYLRKIVAIEHHLYDQIVLIGPHVTDERYGLMDIVRDTGKVVKIYQDFDVDEVNQKFYKFLRESRDAGKDTLVIVDDPIGIPHFVKSGNTRSPWNQLMTGVKQMRVAIKFSVQGDVGLSPICRKQCDRIVIFPDYDSPVKMLDWCAVMNSHQDFARLIETHRKMYHALVICKYRGMKAFFLLKPDMKISPIESI